MFIAFLCRGAPAPFLGSLSLFPFLSFCLEGKTGKPGTSPLLKKCHGEQRPGQAAVAPQMSHSPASTFWRRAWLGRGCPGALGLLFLSAFLPKCCFSRNKPTAALFSLSRPEPHNAFRLTSLVLQLRQKSLKHPFKHLKQMNQPVKSHLSTPALLLY